MRYAKLALLAICIACATISAAQGTCSLPMLQGTYLVEHTGLVYMGANAPYSLLGLMKVSSLGDLEYRYVVASAFGTQTINETGHWDVTPDCKLTITFSGGSKSEGFVLYNGDELRMMVVDPLVRTVPSIGSLPAVGSGTIRRISAGANTIGNCSTGMLRGTYAQTCEGFMAQAGMPPTFMPFRAAIMLNSDGMGNFEGSGALALGGQKLPFAYKNGTNSVDSNCWATATFENTTIPGVWNEVMIVFDSGKEMISTTTGPANQVDMCRFTRIGR